MDLYSILEVDSSATELEIKKSYRKLALKYHPDKVGEEDRESAEIKFKEVCHAYEVLSDEKKRADYDLYGDTDPMDRGGHAPNGNPFGHQYGGQREYNPEDFFDFFRDMGGNGPRGGRQQNRKTDDAEINVEVTLEDLFKGKVVKFTSTRNIICKSCSGTGARKAAKSKTCYSCEGKGHQIRIKRLGPGMVAQEEVRCTTCDGTGKTISSKYACKTCKGKKTVEETKILEFEIAPGSPNVGSIVLAGEADQHPAMEAGDVVLQYTCKEHDVFTRRGDDLFSKFKIPLVDALSGFSAVVCQHLDGRAMHVTTPKGKVIKPGHLLKIPGEGMRRTKQGAFSKLMGASYGDLYIEIEIEFPQDNWYLEVNDITKLKNVLPNDLQNKNDIKKQQVPTSSLPEANIEYVDKVTLATEDALPSYEEPQQQSHANGHAYAEESFYGGFGEQPQAECATQ
ncbi:hypothetical protein FT663_03437 [Candidozyma haemuli var. vulneris]|uniref:Chaperone DnaJ n=1 Tax=Candidozyma haemuli TaxID=45357 RepID=A0A2V1AZB6_9ASCO|nr:hypothetical protein CXQ85_002957 [[Candida] haemuloni]KAF3989866.1 hypothetical protein FT663_03437 [[Candida] haemuloni var. vulneris]KAF3991390.1 hypothetical protein FT662_01745 [[Candida] haemuloni var. vulneris]PVH23228.1 hypothetical protein CXQ85_002957 [[Candida] haemuloni]